MRSNSHKSIAGLLAVSIFVLLCISVSTGKCSGENAQETYNNLLKSLSARNNPNIATFLTQWAEYLKSSSTYSIDEHIEAFYALQKEYSQEISQMEQCLENRTKPSKDYDRTWMEKFIAHFGVPYLRDNEKSALINLGTIVSGSTERCCGQVIETLIFKESVLFSAYRYYLNLFLEFYDKQPQAAKNALKTRKEAAENFLKLIDFASMTKILLGSGMPSHTLSEIQAKNSDKAIHEYFIKNPPDCTIDPFKAIEDFRESIKNN